MDFETIAAEITSRPGVERSTMMGVPCLRVDGAFFVGFHEGSLLVKLPRERVAAAVAEGEGNPFAPAGKVFREWLAVPAKRADTWSAWAEEALAFVGG